MPNKILVVLIIIGAIVGLVILVGWNSGRKENTSEQKTDSQVKEAQTGSPVIEDITAPQAQSLIQQNRENQNFIIIDVRTPSEYTSGHIENAINIDYSASNFRSELGKLDKNKAYLIYCRSGNRSQKALEVMKELGFSEVYNILGGITSWSRQDLPTVK